MHKKAKQQQRHECWTKMEMKKQLRKGNAQQYRDIEWILACLRWSMHRHRFVVRCVCVAITNGKTKHRVWKKEERDMMLFHCTTRWIYRLYVRMYTMCVSVYFRCLYETSFAYKHTTVKHWQLFTLIELVPFCCRFIEINWVNVLRVFIGFRFFFFFFLLLLSLSTWLFFSWQLHHKQSLSSYCFRFVLSFYVSVPFFLFSLSPNDP